MNDEIKMWDMNNYFIFDDTYDHQAWNYTDENRIVLILDILKKKL
jgi:beta-hydroxylase